MRRTILALTAIIAVAACSDSTAPAPTFLGTWHVKVTSFSPDSLEPNPFTITVTAGHGDTLHVAMAPVQWDHGPNYVFDSAYTTVMAYGVAGDSMNFFEKDAADEYSLGLIGGANAKRDTITGQIGVVDNTFSVIGLGTFVATKH